MINKENKLLNKIPELMKNVKEKSPLTQCITNFVTVNDCANAVLAIGASPIMANDAEEMEEIVNISNALVINIGTLHQAQIKAMKVSSKYATKTNTPITLDPVGVGVSKLRNDTTIDLIKNNDNITKSYQNSRNIDKKYIKNSKTLINLKSKILEVERTKKIYKNKSNKIIKNDDNHLNKTNNNSFSINIEDDFMKMYYTFYRNSLKEKKNLNQSLPKLNYSSLSTHRFSFINKFINRNVSEKLTREKQNKKVQARIKEKSQVITSKIKDKEEIKQQLNEIYVKLNNMESNFNLSIDKFEEAYQKKIKTK